MKIKFRLNDLPPNYSLIQNLFKQMATYEQKRPLKGQKLVAQIGQFTLMMLLMVAFTPSISAQADCCDQGGKPAAITVKYTGDGCEVTTHNQDPNKVQCEGDPNDDDLVYIRATEKENGTGKIWFEGYVALNDDYVIDAAYANQNKLKSKTFVHIYSTEGGSLLQFVEFHTSCSQPIAIGDRFGANQIEGIVFEDGTSCGDDGNPPNPPLPDCCDLGGKPALITVTYTGEACDATSHSQDPDKVQCDGNPNMDNAVYIRATEKEDGSGKIWFEGTVGLNETFNIDAAYAGENKLKSKTFVHIFNTQGGSLIQFVEFHTSCSQPIAVGNQFGANRIEGIVFEDGVTCGPPPPCVNFCDGGIVGEDEENCEGYNPEIIFEIEAPCEDTPDPQPITDCCDQGDKPAAITVRYTGEGCEATFHTQDPDKVQCEGDPNDDGMVYIRATEKENGTGKIWFEGNVALDDTYVIDAANANQDKLKSKTFVHIYNHEGGSLIQFVEFHTSCSQPLGIGNQFGANLIEGIDFEDGTSCGESSGGGGGAGEDCCEDGGKPAIVTMTYTGESCASTSHNQDPSKVQCEGNPNFDNSVYIRATEKENGTGKIWFEGTVGLNETFNIDAANANENKLKSKTFLHIYSHQGGALIQFIEFHTSCSQPLAIGNQFGSARIESITFEDGTSCAPPVPDVEYQWLSSTMACPSDISQAIAGANGPNYDPEYIFQTTYYVRLVRRGGCTDAEWVAGNCVIKEVNPPCDPCIDLGGDSDADGFCDDEDCVPDDPFYPNTPGTPCDDGNPDTHNDMVTDDGCDCAGEPICVNATDGGTIGLGDGGIFSSLSVCIGENTTIQNNTAPSGGSGALEVVWIKSPSVNDCNTAFSELAAYNVGQIWDDFIAAGGFGAADPSIGSTSWMFVNDGDADDLSLNVNVDGSNCYTRCVRRDGCLTFDGESNIVSIIGEDCTGGTTGYTACDNDITLTGYSDANVVQVHDVNAGWAIVYSCGAWTGNGACGDPQVINLPDGNYQLRVIPAGSGSFQIDESISLPATCANPLISAPEGNTAEQKRWNKNSSSPQVGSSLNLNQAKTAQFDLYPNPAKDLVHLNMSEYQGKDVFLKVINEVGMEVQRLQINELEATVLELNTSNFAQGLYLVIVQVENQAPAAKKLVISKTDK